MRKGEIACSKQFLFFSQCFLPYMVLVFHFKCTLICSLQLVSIWTSLKFRRLVMGKFSATMDLLSNNMCTSWIIFAVRGIAVYLFIYLFIYYFLFMTRITNIKWEFLHGLFLKTLWLKTKLLIASNFSFCYNEFHDRPQQDHIFIVRYIIS